ncbi:MAG TPA: YdeI/OmpD-associated family protein [Allosphingosinicella sp.]|nr:YdeI/OmpD-associated family protein [Allosphingosinicella sp.]
MTRDQRIDAYIARQADFARPILEHLRAAVHAACPDCEETLKWSAPTFMYKNEQLAMMAAFKQHATFGFWRGSLVVGDDGEQKSAMGQFGRLTSIDDLPAPDVLTALIRKAKALTDAGVKPPRNKAVKEPFTVPDDLRSALDANRPAAATFAGFSPSAQRDYVEWITGAKQPATREKRLVQAVEWMAEGKKRNWKYENC